MPSYNHFLSYKLFLFLNILLLISCQQSIFRFNLEPNIEECFSEYFPDKTLVIFEVASDEGKCRYVLTNPKKVVIEDKQSVDYTYPFTTYEGGVYEICITNLERKKLEILFALKYGVGAKDYSSIARAKDMSHRISFSQSHENVFESFLDSISSKVMIFSSIVIVIMILVGYMETLYLKNFMRRRKII